MSCLQNYMKEADEGITEQELGSSFYSEFLPFYFSSPFILNAFSFQKHSIATPRQFLVLHLFLPLLGVWSRYLPYTTVSGDHLPTGQLNTTLHTDPCTLNEPHRHGTVTSQSQWDFPEFVPVSINSPIRMPLPQKPTLATTWTFLKDQAHSSLTVF